MLRMDIFLALLLIPSLYLSAVSLMGTKDRRLAPAQVAVSAILATGWAYQQHWLALVWLGVTLGWLLVTYLERGSRDHSAFTR